MMARAYDKRIVALVAVLIASLLGLLAAFLFSLTQAARHFDRAAAAQAQLAAVSRIEAIAAIGLPRSELIKALRDYRRSINDETALLGTDPATIAAQDREVSRADRLAALALAPGDRPALIDLVERIVGRERFEVDQVTAATERTRVETTIMAVLLALCAVGAGGGGISALMAANRDLAREVEARTADLQAVDQSRRLFFAKASHELRTPVTVMRGEAEVSLADRAATADDLRGALGHVLANADFLGHRLDELLGLASAEEGRIILAATSIDLGTVLTRAIGEATSYARSAEVRLDMAASEAALPVRGDARWLGQALLAIIDNGVKFSPLGGTLHLSIDRQDGRATIAIKDDGAGVMPAELPRIFDAYYQTGEGRMRGGTGLGLALARWVVEQHRGTIVAANDPAGGCRIAITLPLEPLEAAA